MRRQRRTHHQYADDDDYQSTNASTNTGYQTLHNETEDFLQMDRLSRGGTPKYRFENTIEAKVEDGDTLQALALRFHCTVADIKRLNKIDKDNEIHARKVVKIPVTVHSVLLGALPAVHTSGSNSPKHSPKLVDGINVDSEVMLIRNPLEDARMMLSEKLMIASVNAGGSGTDALTIRGSNGAATDSILNAKNSMYGNDTGERTVKLINQSE